MAHIIMIGDCTLATDYLPKRLRNETLLQERLRQLYPHDAVTVTNEGLEGETVAQFLKRYARTFARNAPPDYIIIRYGVNDRKAYGVEGFRARLEELCARLRHDFPRARLVLETGIYVDYPAHYEFDRNAVLQPIYEVIRELARTQGDALVDIYERMRRETEQGNWDLRVRGYGVVDDEIPIYNASLDHLHEGDVRWWTNIHPNPEGIRVIADEEARVFQAHWPTTLAV